MKKNTPELFLQLFFGVVAIALMTGGAIMFVASFFSQISALTSILITCMGAILFNSVRLYLVFTSSLDKLNNKNPNKNITPPIKTEIISINENTTPEQMNELKEKFPFIIDELEKILDNTNANPTKKSIETMTIKQLQDELHNAVENNEFEKAAEIRDEIKKRKS